MPRYNVQVALVGPLVTIVVEADDPDDAIFKVRTGEGDEVDRSEADFEIIGDSIHVEEEP